MLSVLVALGLIAVLLAAEYAIPRWLHPGPGESGSFFSSNNPAPTPSTNPGIDPNSSANRNSTNAQPFECPHGGANCLDPKARPTIRKSPNTSARRGTARSADPQAGTVGQNGAEPPQSPTRSQDRAAEENLRATEEATAHMVELEREEFDWLADRARAIFERIEAALKQQPAAQLRESLAFSQQRLQNDLSQANTALKSADVQKTQIYLDLAKGELDKLGKLLGNQ